MSIKHNIKRRMLMVVALAMTVAVLAAGTAHAQTSSPSQMSITQTPSAPEVVVGEPVTFHITLTNESPDDVSSNGSVYDVLPGGTVHMDVVVVPQKAGAITNEVKAPMSSSEATVLVNAAK
jgi:uncharacterized repeat protein (TIGR01451 family)